jgi:hypothetical protein
MLRVVVGDCGQRAGSDRQSSRRTLFKRGLDGTGTRQTPHGTEVRGVSGTTISKLTVSWNSGPVSEHEVRVESLERDFSTDALR